jgi:type IV pilus assembly protein PilA
MKPEFQAKFLHYLNKKKNQEEGFTLIELLVVIIIIGILAAIALPSLLGQVNKAKQAEAKNNIGAINRAQQAYFLEYQQFTTDLTQLGVGIKTQTTNYFYTLADANGVINNKAYSDPALNRKGLKAYTGIVGTTIGNTQTGEALTVAFACESNIPTQNVAENVSNVTANNGTSCPPGYKDLAGTGNV